MAMGGKSQGKGVPWPQIWLRFGSTSTTKKPKVFGGFFFFFKAGNLDMFFVVLVCNDYLDANPKSFYKLRPLTMTIPGMAWAAQILLWRDVLSF